MKKLCCVVSVVPVCIFTVNVSFVVEALQVDRLFLSAAIASMEAIDLQHIGANLLLLKTVSNFLGNHSGQMYYS